MHKCIRLEDTLATFIVEPVSASHQKHFHFPLTNKNQIQALSLYVLRIYIYRESGVYVMGVFVEVWRVMWHIFNSVSVIEGKVGLNTSSMLLSLPVSSYVLFITNFRHCSFIWCLHFYFIMLICSLQNVLDLQTSWITHRLMFMFQLCNSLGLSFSTLLWLLNFCCDMLYRCLMYISLLEHGTSVTEALFCSR